MKKKKLMTLTFKRVIPAAPAAVYDAWLSLKANCGPWHDAMAREFKPKQGGLYYFLHGSRKDPIPHFGRFVKLERGKQIKMTWMSPYTHGTESELQVDLKKKGAGTVLTLKHAKLSNDKEGWAHNDGWKYYMDEAVKHFQGKAKR